MLFAFKQERMSSSSAVKESEKPNTVPYESNEDEKHSIRNHTTENVDPNEVGGDVDFSNVDEKKVLRKMDLRLLPMLSLLYLLSFLDRGNIGNAKIEGLTEDLHMTGPQYNWCLTVFFFTYVAFEVPSNLMQVSPRCISLADILIGLNDSDPAFGSLQSW